MPKLTLDGIDLGYEVRGDGPPVLFVHGSVTNGMMTWSAQLPLAERWKLVVVDRPGFGSSSPAEREDFAVDAGLVAGFLDRTHDLWDENRVHLGRAFLWRRHLSSCSSDAPASNPFAHGDRAAGL